MSLKVFLLVFTTTFCGQINIINNAQLEKQFKLTNRLEPLQAKIDVPSQFYNRWFNIVKDTMKVVNKDTSNGINVYHLEIFLSSMLSVFLTGDVLERELYNLRELFFELKAATSNNCTEIFTFQNSSELKIFVKRLALAFGLVHFEKYIDLNGDKNCPIEEMHKHKEWSESISTVLSEATSLNTHDQRELWRIHGAISWSTDYAWLTKISSDDYSLCENKAVSMAEIVIKTVPVFYDYIHNYTVVFDYCFECPTQK